MKNCNRNNSPVTGEFVTLGNERFYAINNVDKMAPFFVSVISNSDHPPVSGLLSPQLI